MAAAVVQFKRGAYAGLPALQAGEPGFSTDKYDFFIGLDNTINGNKFFGSQRYWQREDGIESAYLNLVDRDGSNKIALKTPNVLSGVTTTFYQQLLWLEVCYSLMLTEIFPGQVLSPRSI